jgi:hypothetical protein
MTTIGTTVRDDTDTELTGWREFDDCDARRDAIARDVATAAAEPGL